MPCRQGQHHTDFSRKDLYMRSPCADRFHMLLPRHSRRPEADHNPEPVIRSLRLHIIRSLRLTIGRNLRPCMSHIGGIGIAFIPKPVSAESAEGSTVRIVITAFLTYHSSSPSDCS